MLIELSPHARVTMTLYEGAVVVRVPDGDVRIGRDPMQPFEPGLYQLRLRFEGSKMCEFAIHLTNPEGMSHRYHSVLLIREEALWVVRLWDCQAASLVDVVIPNFDPALDLGATERTNRTRLDRLLEEA